MQTAAPSLTSIAGPDAADGDLTPDLLARRARQRRQMLGMVALSYVVDGLILLIYAYAGSTPLSTAPAYVICGLLSVSSFWALSETRLNDRFKDHYFVVQQSSVSLVIMLMFLYIAPEVGCVFLCSLFVIFAFGSLRSTPQQTAVLWTVMTFGLAALFLMTDKPIDMPNNTYIERLATLMVFVMTIGRCMFVGIFSSSLRESLYKRGIELREAYKRIEELAELDELTGSFNRRSIMRSLDDEVARAHHTNMPCSVALIDLDWFKKINDLFGHPTGDEVLRTFAITMFANIRGIDKFGRYGGEEFLLILPETTDQAAERTLDRLRAIIADLDWSTFSHSMTVTISAGVVALQPNETPDSVLARADAALYRAKDMGRNRIIKG
ncbi:diguanylate cyclase [Afipia sp. Root123D2]|uniref:GGDEF domain-containing protein n=1 Tax=Afipia sp. Root123D2 TaxID=1736436 RepID=UPI0006F398C9|nr:GGDEF domain-containing protein [Afipia sp. Root123D2]KQW18501.1 diguanylate cyclase [Afipia sp. Root123D2]